MPKRFDVQEPALKHVRGDLEIKTEDRRPAHAKNEVPGSIQVQGRTFYLHHRRMTGSDISARANLAKRWANQNLGGKGHEMILVPISTATTPRRNLGVAVYADTKLGL